MSKHDILLNAEDLGTCRVCGGSEGELPTDCPGYTMNYAERQAVFKAGVDYINGTWTDKGKRPAIRYKEETTHGVKPGGIDKAYINPFTGTNPREERLSFQLNITAAKSTIESIRELYEHEPELFFKLLTDGAPSGYRGIIEEVPRAIRNLKYWINPKDWAGLDMFTDEMEEADELAQRALDFMKRVKP